MRLRMWFALSLIGAGQLCAQYPALSLPPSGNNQKATVIQHIGLVEVSVAYSSPAVHAPDGTDRRGQIWGKLVPWGTTDLGFGRQSPWRGGANENTVFTTSHDIKVEGKPLAAGRYGLHFLPGKEQWTVIFSSHSGDWGSYFYDPADDALRVDVKPRTHEYREWLTYEFPERRPQRATLELQWEELALPIVLTVENPEELYFTRLKRQLQGQAGFSPAAYLAVAQFCVQKNTHLEDALKLTDTAMHMPFIGVENFDALSTQSQVLLKLGREKEANEAMVKAVHNPSATPVQIHQYGRQLQLAGKQKEALAVFELNAQRNGDTWPVHVGLARGYSGVGEYPKALEHARKALDQAPDPINRKSLEGMVETLSHGQPVK